MATVCVCVFVRLFVCYGRAVNVVTTSQRRHHQQRSPGSHVTDRDCRVLRLWLLQETGRFPGRGSFSPPHTTGPAGCALWWRASPVPHRHLHVTVPCPELAVPMPPSSAVSSHHGQPLSLHNSPANPTCLSETPCGGCGGCSSDVTLDACVSIRARKAAKLGGHVPLLSSSLFLLLQRLLGGVLHTVRINGLSRSVCQRRR